MIDAGLTITVAGIAIVALFLIALVGAMNLLYRFHKRFAPATLEEEKAPSARHEPSPVAAAAIAAAYRHTHPPSKDSHK